LPEEARHRLYKAAVDAAKAVSYKNAGTVEFIVDENNDHYFLEMNTRLQVEHPVTEEVTGFDLVEWQFEIAKGNKLPVIDQTSIKSTGHAIEFRIYAEDPIKFMPSPGTIQKLDWGDTKGIRIDSGYEEGGKVTPFYDPLISKVIVHATTREEAIQKSIDFLSKVYIEGLKTNIPFFTNFIKSEEFISGDYSTSVLTSFNRG